MSPRKTADPCMFCGNLPCQCNVRPLKRNKTSKAVQSKQDNYSDLKPEPIARGSRVARMKEAARATPPTPNVAAPVAHTPLRMGEDTGSKREHMKASAEIENQEQLVLDAAIRTLAQAELLDQTEVQQYAKIISTIPTLEEEKILWKLRHHDRQVQNNGE